VPLVRRKWRRCGGRSRRSLLKGRSWRDATRVQARPLASPEGR